MNLRMLLAGAFLALATPAHAAAADGGEVFDRVCAACHNAGGIGTPGVAPPLADPPLWTRLGPETSARFIAGVVIAGFSGTIFSQGMGYYGLVMPPQSQLSDEELAAVTTHVLRNLGGIEAEVTPADIAAVRAAPPGHKDLMQLRGGSQ
ncbi:c-type cytochrome [Rhodovulum euryhalinum]|uniref:Mono/diheme cytochrome c family protein n=1 Tax=Rhodovulum euryhalinum TaxID=35805 RepID=A0A4R2K877_9RHOB|nr:cytochrome c [Rhodovulum euryhalinum]TCO69563.1 mono/diheme cytochrome c family protein [Rhodovulum euryhalinum]